MIKRNGFTLIEIMIAVAIISLLVAIAVPNYTNYVTQARRNEGTTLLMQMMQQQERYFTEELTYATDLTLLGFTVDATGNVASENGFYLVSAGFCGTLTTAATCVNLTATPQGLQNGDGNITLDSGGNRTPAGFWR